jgi:hypothetical protein
MDAVVLKSTITCPVCEHMKDELMVTDAFVWLYACEHCKTVLRPKSGDCCVYCSYCTNRCPPMQQSDACCTARVTSSSSTRAAGMCSLNKAHVGKLLRRALQHRFYRIVHGVTDPAHGAQHLGAVDPGFAIANALHAAVYSHQPGFKHPVFVVSFHARGRRFNILRA